MWITCGTRPIFIPKPVQTPVEKATGFRLKGPVYKGFILWIRKVLKP
jgi:hypothetical protein